jgi:hypothetical protein
MTGTNSLFLVEAARAIINNDTKEVEGDSDILAPTHDPKPKYSYSPNNQTTTNSGNKATGDRISVMGAMRNMALMN